MDLSTTTVVGDTSSTGFASAADEWTIRRTATLMGQNMYGTTNGTYGKFWGEDGGVEATTRMRSSGLGFEGWYGTPKQLKGNSMGLSDTAVTTQIPREYDDPVAKRHVIQKDHWFMGAKYPNPHTLREDIREAYYTVRGGLPTAGGEEASR
eukprot:jgi/Tetstr1/458133/TSEL_044625.t1